MRLSLTKNVTDCFKTRYTKHFCVLGSMALRGGQAFLLLSRVFKTTAPKASASSIRFRFLRKAEKAIRKAFFECAFLLEFAIRISKKPIFRDFFHRGVVLFMNVHFDLAKKDFLYLFNGFALFHAFLIQ